MRAALGQEVIKDDTTARTGPFVFKSTLASRGVRLRDNFTRLTAVKRTTPAAEWRKSANKLKGSGRRVLGARSGVLEVERSRVGRYGGSTPSGAVPGWWATLSG